MAWNALSWLTGYRDPQTWNPLNPVGTEQLNPQYVSNATPLQDQILPGQGVNALSRYVDPATGQLTYLGQQEAANPLMNFDTGGIGAIRAFHGSPHLFPPTARNPLGEFDPAKLGTGEGAQAYGVGEGYLAEHEGIARTYRDDLSALSLDGKPLTGTTPAQRLVITASGDVDKALADYQAHADSLTPGQRQRGNVDQILAELQDMKGRVQPGTGHMYEVNVRADPEQFLHWDKPLSEQSPRIQQFFRDRMGPEPPEGSLAARVRASRMDAPGGVAYQSAAQADPGGHAAVSQALNDAGIPGIRYLDASSRGAGEGTHNLVVFSPAIMDIVRRYGIAGLFGGGAAAGAAGIGQEQ